MLPGTTYHELRTAEPVVDNSVLKRRHPSLCPHVSSERSPHDSAHPTTMDKATRPPRRADAKPTPSWLSPESRQQQLSDRDQQRQAAQAVPGGALSLAAAAAATPLGSPAALLGSPTRAAGVHTAGDRTLGLTMAATLYLRWVTGYVPTVALLVGTSPGYVLCKAH